MSWLRDLFVTVLNMSITASFVAAGVILVRLLLKKAPKLFSYILWAPVLFRLLCPFSFNSVFSIFNLINLKTEQESSTYKFVPGDIGIVHTPAVQNGTGGSIDSIGSGVNAALPAPDSSVSMNTMEVWMNVFSIIWIAGVIALSVYSIISYIKVKGRLQTATRVAGNVFETDAINTAFVCGYIRPKIYVPSDIRDADLSYILEHERTHIRRKDYVLKPIAYLAVILHWFNPLMWLCFAFMSRDMEMSCDESVLRRLGDGSRGGYSKSLLSLSVRRKGILTANPLAFGENHVKSRIRNILNFRKPAFWVTVAAVAAVCAATIAFAANPPEGNVNPSENAANSPVNDAYTSEDEASSSGDEAFTSEDYKISLRYPAYWKANPEYTDRFEGEDGFFQVAAIDGDGMSIDEVAKNDAFHQLEPYGSDPQIINRVIDGQEARLILPSSDQPKEMRNQAGLIIKYPQAVKIGSTVYHYFVLWADEQHIEEIGNTLTFLSNAAGDENTSAGGENSPDKGETGHNEIADLVEDNLAAIISSPQSFSDPQDYINAHQEEYESIIKYGGEEALQYMLSQFKNGNADGLRGYIMMRLCREMLGARDNVTDETLIPQEWYKALSVRQETELPDFEYDGDDPVEKLVYDTEISMNSRPQYGFTIVAPKIFGSYEEDGLLKVFVTTYSARYKLYDNVLEQEGGSIVPAAITFKKGDDGSYVLEKYEQAKDGAYWGPSIREFCTMPSSGKKIRGLADKIIKHYTNRDDIDALQWENLYKHLKAHNIEDATLYDVYGEVEFSMSKYR